MSSKGSTLETVDLNVYYNKVLAVEQANIFFHANEITALIGPSGCGKSSLLRSLNRMHESVKGASVTGKVLINGENIYDPSEDPVIVRRRIGMVFQKSNPFPQKSIYDNVLYGYVTNRGKTKKELQDEIVEQALRGVGLWDEVSSRLKTSGAALSGGQQQRLCIARAIAVEPEVLLMDEPCSALDEISTLRIEALMKELVKDYTIVLVTHNLFQAHRVADKTAFMLAENSVGRIIEYAATEELFTSPKNPRTADYVSGRIG